jgi:hypothetical protein
MIEIYGSTIETEDEPIKEIFDIKQADKNYKLIILLYLDYISIEISDINKFMQTYEIIKLNLEAIKNKHISFSKFSSLQEFRDILKDSIDDETITISKTSKNIIRFELKKFSVFFELIKKRISSEEIIENLSIEMEKFNQKLSELEITRKMKDEMDEKIKNLNEENKKLREEIKYIKEDNIIKRKELLNLKQEFQVIKNFIEKPKNNEVKPIWTKKFSFKWENEKRKKLEIISKDINNIISENEEKNKRDTLKKINNYYKIEIFEHRENFIDKKKAGNVNNQNRYNSHRKTPKRNNTKHRIRNSLKNILEESANINSFQERTLNNFNLKKDLNNKLNTKKLIKIENNFGKITNTKTIKRINIFNTNKLTRNNSKQFITPIKEIDRRFSSHSFDKQKYT